MSQVLPDFLIMTPDSNYVQAAERKWSLRLYSAMKSQRLRLNRTNSDQTRLYVPNNVLSAGIGFSYNRLGLDLGLNLNLADENVSERFDFQGNIIFKPHIINFFIQQYGGLEVIEPNEGFRDDLETRAYGFNYFYRFNHKKLSLAAVMQGTEIQRKSTGQFSLGMFFNYTQLENDSLLLPATPDNNINDPGKITNMMMGPIVSYSYVQVLPHNFFAFASLGPGTGINFNRSYENDWTLFTHRLVYKLHLRATMGYAGERFYTLFSFFTESYFFEQLRSVDSGLDVAQFKLVAGYRL